MTHEELEDKFRKAFGGKIPNSARDSWANFLRTKGLSFKFRYEWIKDQRIYKWATDHPEIDIADGAETVEFFDVSTEN